MTISDKLALVIAMNSVVCHPKAPIDLSRFTEEQCFEIIRNSRSQLQPEVVIAYADQCKLTADHRLELAKALATINVGSVMKYLDKFAFSEPHRFALAEFLIKTMPYYVAQTPELFNLTEEHRFELIQKLEPNVSVDVSIACLSKFRLTEEHRALLAKKLIESDPVTVIKEIRHFDLSDECNLLIAMDWFVKYPYELTSDSLIRFNLSNKDQFTLALHVAENISYRDRRYLDAFVLTTPQLFARAQVLAKRFPWEVVRDIDRFGDLDAEQKKQLCLIAASKDSGVISTWPSSMCLCRTVFLGSPVEQTSAESKIDPELLSQLKEWIDKTKKALVGYQEAGTMIREEVTSICAVADYWMACMSPKELKWAIKNQLLCALDFQETYTPSLIYLVEEISHVYKLFNRFDECSPQNNPFKLLLIRLLNQGVKPTDIEEFLDALERDKKWLHNLSTKNYALLYETLELLSVDKTLDGPEKAVIIRELRQDLARNANALFVILVTKQSVLLKGATNPLDLRKIVEQAFQAVLPGPIDMEKFNQVFGAYRQPDAMMLYAARLSTMNDPVVMQDLGAHIESVLNGTYPVARYSPEGNPQLKTILKYDPKILDMWKKNKMGNVSQILGDQFLPKGTLRDWLTHSLVVDESLGDLGSYPYLQRFLAGEENKAVQELIEQNKAKKRLNEASMLPTEFMAEQQAQRSLALQQKICQILKAPDDRKALGVLKDLEQSSLLASEPALKQSLQTKIAEMEMTDVLATMTISNTDDPQEVFLMGAEGTLSCQHYLGPPENSVGLLGTLRHGQTKLIAVKDQSGKIAARALFRLMWDGSEPVLFLERFYSHHTDDRFQKAILNVAHYYAKKMECCLTSYWFGDGGSLFPKKLQSLGGPAESEYVDAIGGLSENNGTFFLEPNTTNLLSKPQSSESKRD